MSLPSLMYRLETIYFLFHLITFTLVLSFPVRRSPQNLTNCLIYVKLQHSIPDQSGLAPKWIFTIFFRHCLPCSQRVCTEVLDLLRFWIKHPCRGPQWKGAVPSIADSLLSTEKRVRIWGQPRGTTVGALCLPGSLAAAWVGRFQVPGGFLGSSWDHVLCNDNMPLLRKEKAWGQWSHHCIWVGQSQKVGLGRVIFWEHRILELLETAPDLWICASQTHRERLTHMASLITPVGLSSRTSMLWDVMHLPKSYFNQMVAIFSCWHWQWIIHLLL